MVSLDGATFSCIPISLLSELADLGFSCEDTPCDSVPPRIPVVVGVGAEDKGDDGLSDGEIVGIAIGAFFGLLALAGLFLLLLFLIGGKSMTFSGTGPVSASR